MKRIVVAKPDETKYYKVYGIIVTVTQICNK